MVAIAARTNVATLSLLLVTVACHVIVTSACVPVDCVYQDVPPQADKYTLRDPWIIFAIILACIFFVIILLILLWLCCFCCYRNESDTAPAIVKRVVLVRRPQKQVVVCEKPKPKPKCLHVVAPPVECLKPPPPPPPPVEKVIIVAPPAPPQPTSLTLTVSDACNSSTFGPTATTLVERPLKFTFTPSYNNQQTTTCGYRTRDVTPTSCDVRVPAQRRCKCRHGAVCATCQQHV